MARRSSPLKTPHSRYACLMDLGSVGVWWSGSWRTEDGSTEVAAELEDLGYGTLWSSAGFEAGLPERFKRLLSTTTHTKVASGIISIWATTSDAVGRDVEGLDREYPGRFVLGLGTSHGPIVDNYNRPYSHMVEFLDRLDLGAPAVSQGRRVLAALGPRMLELARDRAAGAHPYFVPVEHTARARAILGRGPLLAPEVTVVLEHDPGAAREVARTFTAGYLTLPNYANNLRSLGFDEDDFVGGGSDRLVDAVIAWGDVGTVSTRVKEHLTAGADHVCIQVLSTSGTFPLKAYRDLAPSLLGP